MSAPQDPSAHPCCCSSGVSVMAAQCVAAVSLEVALGAHSGSVKDRTAPVPHDPGRPPSTTAPDDPAPSQPLAPPLPPLALPVPLQQAVAGANPKYC